jgi:hypothetical protein
MSSQAYTPAVLACRKILMNVSVALGAEAGEPFVNYVQFLADTGYVPLRESIGSTTFGRNRTRQIMR